MTGSPQALEHVISEVFANSRNVVAALTALASKPAGDVDEKALAAAMAPLLTARTAALTDTDRARVATAVGDEQAKRQAA